MKLLALLITGLIIGSPFAEAKKSGYTPFTQPYSHYQAAAVQELLHDVQTVGGVLRWLEQGHESQDLVNLKKLLIKMDITEDQYFPNYQVKGNSVYYGRNKLTIHKDHVELNKRKYYRQEGQTLTGFVDQICKDLGCGSHRSAYFDPLFFGEAQAIAPLLAFGLGVAATYVVMRWGWPWQWFRRRQTTIVSQQAYYTGGSAIGQQAILSAIASGGTPKCEGNVPKICGASKGWFSSGNNQCNEIPSQLRDGALSCEDNIKMITGSAQVNDNRVNDGFQKADGAVRATSSSIPTKSPPKKNLKPWEKRHRWH